MNDDLVQPGVTSQEQFVVCTETFTGFDPYKYANDSGAICVDSCPDNFDSFMTQMGVEYCIEQYGFDEIETWNICEKSSHSCNCVKAYESTNEQQITDAKYRCVPQTYADRLLFRSGVDSLDESGEQSVMIA